MSLALPVLLLAATCPLDISPGAEQRVEAEGHYGWHAVRVPDDLTSPPEAGWPVVLSYHGYGDGLRPNVRILQAVTGGEGFVLVGMDYGSRRYYQALEDRGLRLEQRRAQEVLELLETCMPVDRDAVFLAGYSQGGYAASNLAERMLDELAGLVILGAGRGWGDGRMPSRGLIDRFPVFIGAGEDDRPHGDRAAASAGVYARWGAVVSLERWPGTDHFEGWRWYQDAPTRGANLREWLLSNRRQDRQDRD